MVSHTLTTDLMFEEFSPCKFYCGLAI
jgi:hypothetical protein